MRHPIDSTTHIRPQVLSFGFTEPYRQVVLYRFLDADGALLYVGITSRPTERWQKHRRLAPWWPSVAEVLIEIHPTRSEAEAAELVAIKTERPLFNIHAATGNRVNESKLSQTSLTRYSRVVLPRVGGGVGVGGELRGAIHACNPTSAKPTPVDNSPVTPITAASWMSRCAAEFGGGSCP